jgi:hypothetical protein
MRDLDAGLDVRHFASLKKLVDNGISTGMLGAILKK